MSLTITNENNLAWGELPIDIITSNELYLETSSRIESDTSLYASLSLKYLTE